MADSSKQHGPRPRCYFSQTCLTAFVDHAQPSTKKKPFSTVLGQPFSHSLDLVLLPDAASRLKQALTDGTGTLQYARVHMKLSDLIEGDFFNYYVKSGNVFMLSEGRPNVDHVFSLFDGILRLEVDKPTYERLGLEGKAVPNEGRKHVKARFAIEINLRLPSVVHGHKGFERTLWAFRNALNNSVTWLVYDAKPQTGVTGPIVAQQPTSRNVEPDITQLDDVLVPIIPGDIEQDDHITASDLLEWLTMMSAMSPRLQSNDGIDTYLNRYRVPDFPTGSRKPQQAQAVVRFRWHGFVTSSFVTKILLGALKASANDWFAMSATSFHGEAYTVLITEDHTLTWEHLD